MRSKSLGWTITPRNQNTIPTMTMQPTTVITMRKRLTQTDVEDAPPSAVFSRSGNEDMIAPLFSSRRTIDTSPLRAPPSSVDVRRLINHCAFHVAPLSDSKISAGIIDIVEEASGKDSTIRLPNRVYQFRNENTSSERAIFVRSNGASSWSRLHV